MSRIVLITGPKHSGKSSCIKALGELVDGQTIDLDELVEAQSGKSPRELYAIGVESFRKAEALAFSSVLKTSNPKQQIIASGGGLIDNSEVMALLSEARAMQREIIIVYLDVSMETAWQRIVNDGELPVFLNMGNPMGLNPQETHLALHERRAEAYRKLADIIIETENKTVMEIAGEISIKLL